MRKAFFIGLFALMGGFALQSFSPSVAGDCTTPEELKNADFAIVCSQNYGGGISRIYWHNGTVGGTYIRYADGTTSDHVALSYATVEAQCNMQ